MSGRPARNEIDTILDAFHAAAAAADEKAYFDTVTDEVVFLGTAPGERWTGDDFRAFVHSYFSRGIGWTYVASDRSLEVDESGSVAWFDETLLNDHYGTCRGTGVAVRGATGWRIAQYNLTLPIPDEIAAEVVERVRSLG